MALETSYFQLPPTLADEIEKFAVTVEQFRDGALTPEEFRAPRAGFGIYQQRPPDTFMLRVRCTGGGILPRHLRTIAALATEYGGDELHLTTRQEFQIHDLQLTALIGVLRRLYAAGLATRGGCGNAIRNIVASWDAGVAVDEAFDVTPYAVALMNRLAHEADSWQLPRKFKFAFVGQARDLAEAQCTDVGFVACRRDGTPGFAVYVAGGMGRGSQTGHLLHDFIPATQVYAVANAVKRVFYHHGNRADRNKARLRFLWNELGRERFVALYEEELRRLVDAQLTPANIPAPAVWPHQHQSGHATGVDFTRWRERYVTPQKQAGLHTVLLPIARGLLTTTVAHALCDMLPDDNADVLRCTPQQNLAVRHVPAADLERLYAFAHEHFPLARYPRFIGNCISCTGARICALGLCHSRDALTRVERALLASDIDLDACRDVSLGISGCPNACGRHLMTDIGCAGKLLRRGEQTAPAYAIFTGASFTAGAARLNSRVADVAAEDLPALIGDILRGYVRERATYPTFGAYAAARGTDDIRARCAAYQTTNS